MTFSAKYFTLLAATFLWIGFVCAISFMEAWLKFRAPGVTLPIGLGIGKLVFGALNKVEWIFAVIAVVCMLSRDFSFSSPRNLWYGIALLMLALQTFWLLPALDNLADVYISGGTPPPSSLHWYFVAAEVIKVVSLFVGATGIFKVLFP